MLKTSWRLAHLALAVVTCIFLFIASLTGVVLALHAVNERQAALMEKRISHPFATDTETVSASKQTEVSVDSNQVKPSNAGAYLSFLKTRYPGLTAVEVNKYDQVIIETTDESFNQQRYMIHPSDGRILSRERMDPPFVQWNLSLHRSLFLHETGRFVVGIVSFLCIIIIISGIALVLKRQKKLRKFFRKPKGGSRTTKWHVRLAQLFFIPLLITALTGTYLFMKRFQLLPEKPAVSTTYLPNSTSKKQTLAGFPALQSIKITELKRVVFPFFDDPEEYYTVQLTDRELQIHPYHGTIVKETRYPFHTLLGQLSAELHTGSGNSIWAIVLAISSLSITGFIVTGFAITYQRIFRRRRNQAKPGEAEIVILTGTENGSTRRFAESIHEQLTALGYKVYSDDMNGYATYPVAKHLVIFTSTYGDGEAPSSAHRFEKLLKKHPQNHAITFSVVGFGSRHYPDYCAFAYRTHHLLAQLPAARPVTDVHTVNKRSASEFAAWAAAWSEATGIPLRITPECYKFKKK